VGTEISLHRESDADGGNGASRAANTSSHDRECRQSLEKANRCFSIIRRYISWSREHAYTLVAQCEENLKLVSLESNKPKLGVVAPNTGPVCKGNLLSL
jgi:hypothetical protein